MDGPYLDAATSRARREAKEAARRRRSRRRLAMLTGSLAVLLLLGFLAARADDGDPGARQPRGSSAAAREPTPTPVQEVLGPLPGGVDLHDATDAFTIPFK